MTSTKLVVSAAAATGVAVLLLRRWRRGNPLVDTRQTDDLSPENTSSNHSVDAEQEADNCAICLELCAPSACPRTVLQVVVRRDCG
jgi:hypothetical protein